MKKITLFPVFFLLGLILIGVAASGVNYYGATITASVNFVDTAGPADGEMVISVSGGIGQLGYTFNGNALTNLHYAYLTNSFPASGGMAFGGNTYHTNLQADITLGLFSSVSPFFYETMIIYATNLTSSDHTITFPSGVTDWTNGAPVVITCTNKLLTKIHVDHYGRIYTNAYRFPQ